MPAEVVREDLQLSLGAQDPAFSLVKALLPLLKLEPAPFLRRQGVSLGDLEELRQGRPHIGYPGDHAPEERTAVPDPAEVKASRSSQGQEEEQKQQTQLAAFSSFFF